MGDVEWTDEAAAAVSRAILLADGVARDLADYVVEPHTDAVLDALTPHVEAMVREARAEALREAVDVAERQSLTWRNILSQGCKDWADRANWLRARAEEVRRGE